MAAPTDWFSPLADLRRHLQSSTCNPLTRLNSPTALVNLATRVGMRVGMRVGLTIKPIPGVKVARASAKKCSVTPRKS